MKMALLRNLMLSKTLHSSLSAFGESIKLNGPCITIVKFYKYQDPTPRPSGKFRRKVHYPEEYTVKPLDVTRLGGRDPVSGHKVVIGIGGGIKYKYHWVDFKRVGPKEDVPPLEERVILIKDVMERTAKVALVASGDSMRWIIAGTSMKPGDIIRTSQFIPHNPVAAKDGDAYPLGALPIGSQVYSIERRTGEGGFYCNAAGSRAKIIRWIGDKVVIALPSKEEVALPRENMAVVGQVSNEEHHDIPIGSAQRNRELGNRPRSGLWHRKDGRYGRKIKPPRPVKIVTLEEKPEKETVELSLQMRRFHPWEF